MQQFFGETSVVTFIGLLTISVIVWWSRKWMIRFTKRNDIYQEAETDEEALISKKPRPPDAILRSVVDWVDK